ncbi:BlaI/MecI/CopY family transcriptional regulator [Streptomyces sp. NPDC050433]|uniref:BlaI/MecI/CopY family transcriptional regulator n=1 Tax=unclassified Streptomyces TaxID=2593676 RepID=UPI003444FBD8
MRPLGELEAEIMDRLWRWGQPTTVRRIVEDINGTRPVAYTTVMTVADILHTKGWLRREKINRAWVYEATQSREQYTARLMQEALGSTENRKGALLQFVEHMSSEDVQALDAALRAVVRPAADGDRR